MSKLADEINERLISEYISKVRCCDECFASVYCTVTGLRESRVPQNYCVKNIKRYFCDKVKPVDERPQGDLISRSALKKAIKSYADDQYAENEYLGECAIMDIIDDAQTVDAIPNKEGYEMYNKGYMSGYEIGKRERSQGEWLPVSERLPEERINPYTKDFEYVLCSTTWGDVRPYKFGKRIGENKAHFWLAGAIMDKYITAWQPFPEPYKEEGAE